MTINDIVKAWRDPMFRSTRSDVPANPAGMVELAGTALDAVAGGHRSSRSGRSSRSSRSQRRRSSRSHRRSSRGNPI